MLGIGEQDCDQSQGRRPLFGSGEFPQARELQNDAPTRLRHVLGEDHPGTLTSVNDLAADLHALSEPEET